MASERQPSTTDYTAWSNDRLIARVTELEQHLKAANSRFSAASPQPASCTAPASTVPTTSNPPRPFKKSKKAPAPFDPSRYTTRLIAIKFAYLGARYNGYEHHANNSTPLPTVEEELWRALRKTRLVFPKDKGGNFIGEKSNEGEEVVKWEGCEYSKCGRTDRGVSAFGQVVGVRVRSNRPLAGSKRQTKSCGVKPIVNGEATAEDQPAIEASQEPVGEDEEETPFDPIKDELPYPSLLNRVLPPDIRVLAWCPNPPPNFSARFNCKERRYKYFFTNPAFLPTGGASTPSNTADGTPVREGWLDIERMRAAAKQLEGLHDFRNLCKVDPAKQLTNFERRVFYADIEEITTPPPSFLSDNLGLSQNSASAALPTPKLYALVLHGSAFLWHQVRHIAAILFLVGQGLEPPSLIPSLLDVAKNPSKPKYEMAAAVPLVLWDCIFPEPLAEDGEASAELGKDGQKRSTESRPDALEWVYVSDAWPMQAGRSKVEGKGGIMEDLWELWRGRKMDEVLAASLLDVAAASCGRRKEERGFETGHCTQAAGRSMRVFDGGDSARLAGNYVPVMQKEKMESVDVINARYAAKKGLDQRIVQARRSTEDDGDE